jgi:RimJ/RimL family protein N-acetyltransferase
MNLDPRTLASRLLMWRCAGTWKIDYERILIEGGGIRLRPFRADDLGQVLEIVRDPDIVRFSYLPDAWRTEDGARDYLSSQPGLAAEGNRIDLAIEDARDSSLIGHAALRSISWRRRSADVATWVARDARGRGVAAEGLGLISDWAFAELGLLRLCADPDLENIPSHRMLERIGYRRGDTVRTPEGRTVINYSRVREDTG